MDAGIFSGELRVDVEVRGEIRHISAIRRTSTTGKYSDDLTSPVEDYRSRVSRLGEPGAVLAVPQHGEICRISSLGPHDLAVLGDRGPRSCETKNAVDAGR